MNRIAFFFMMTGILISCSSHKRTGVKAIPTHFDSAGLPQQFREVLDEFTPRAFKKCYAPYLSKFRKKKSRKKRSPKPKRGTLKYKISFNGEGVVEKVRRIKKTKLPGKVSKCVEKGLMKLNFGKSEFRSFEIIYPIKFTYK